MYALMCVSVPFESLVHEVLCVVTQGFGVATDPELEFDREVYPIGISLSEVAIVGEPAPWTSRRNWPPMLQCSPSAASHTYSFMPHSVEILCEDTKTRCSGKLKLQRSCKAGTLASLYYDGHKCAWTETGL